MRVITKIYDNTFKKRINLLKPMGNCVVNTYIRFVLVMITLCVNCGGRKTGGNNKIFENIINVVKGSEMALMVRTFITQFRFTPCPFYKNF